MGIKGYITMETAERLTKEAADEGKLVKVGWIAMLLTCIPHNANKEQIKCMKLAYYLGAEHLYMSIMGTLDEGKEATPMDLRRMELIHNELMAFRAIQESTMGGAPARH